MERKLTVDSKKDKGTADYHANRMFKRTNDRNVCVVIGEQKGTQHRPSNELAVYTYRDTGDCKVLIGAYDVCATSPKYGRHRVTISCPFTYSTMEKKLL